MKTTQSTSYVFCFLIVAISVFSYTSCERATNDTSTVSLRLPSSNTSQSVGALTCTKCLKAVVVNVDGEGLSTIKYFNKIDFDMNAVELSGEVTIDVPGGSQRRIQVLAIYRNSDSSKEIQYGSTIVDLFEQEPPPINISLSNLGVFKGGSLVGRYLTGTNLGPTGRVAISLKHVASGVRMELFEKEILNGWFDFFASENFHMTYRVVETGQILFEDATLDSLTPAATIDHVARVSRPSTTYYTSFDGWTTHEVVNEYHDIVYGFFGPAALTSGKVVCLEYNPSVPAGMTFTQAAASNDGSSALNYHHSDTSGHVHGISGRNSSEGVCTTPGPASTSATRYENDRISINKNQFNGNGNDTARSMIGFLSFMHVSSVIKKYDHMSTPYYFKGLPGLIAPTGAMFDGVRLFKKALAANGGFDEAICNSQWLDANGFVALIASDFTTVPYVPSADNVTFELATPVNGTDGYIICPTSGGNLTGFGAAYLGAMQ